MKDELENTVEACFQADLASTESSAPSPTSLEWSLPAEIAKLLQSPERSSEIQLYLISALRILHYRHSGVEIASIAVVSKNEPTCDVAINIEENTSLERILEASRTLMSKAGRVESSSEAARHTENRLVVQYLENHEDSTPTTE
jgi:hypothetical protein